jgi:prevent-host-death family protein
VKSVPASAAKARFSSLLSDVERGEIVDITRHGKTIARLVPPIADEQNRRLRAVAELQAWRKAQPRARMTVEDIVTARDEGRKP